MNENEVELADLPDGLISVTPQPDTLEFIYEQVNGEELISVIIDDALVRHIRLMLTPSAAQYVAMHLWAMATTDLDELRRQWREK